MDSILVSPSDIECCWEKNDACFVKMKTGKVWICEKEIDIETCKIGNFAVGGYTISTKDFIIENQNKSIIKLPLRKRGV